MLPFFDAVVFNEVLVLTFQTAALLALAGTVFCLRRPASEAVPVAVEAAPKFSDAYPLDGVAEETEENLALRQVEEDVPDTGRVFLRGAAKGEFDYWTDRPVSFPNLEALARKWTLVYQEPDAYVERKRVLEARPVQAPSLDSVFAPLKSYAAPTTVVKLEQCNVYRWRGRAREVPLRKIEEPVRPVRYSDFKKNV
jgi:hypothetical protein